LFYEFARRSVLDGHEVTVFTTDAWEPESYHKPWKRRLKGGTETLEGLEIRRFKIRNIPLQFKVFGSISLIPTDPIRLIFGYPSVLLPSFLYELFIQQPHFDLIIAGVLPYTHLMYPAAWLARRKKIPWICVPLAHTGVENQAPLRGYLTASQIRLIESADAVFTTTEAEVRALEERGVCTSKLHTVGAGVNPSELGCGDGARFRERFKVSGPIVLQIGTQTQDKGSIDLIEAMKLLWGAGINLTLVLIGQLTDDFENYYLQAQKPSLYERIICLGFVDDKTKQDALDACNVYVMPSRAESFGIAFLEAWSYSKPVVGARAGGVPCVISDGEDGLLVRFGDRQGIASAVGSLLADDAARRSMGQCGRAKVLANYTWEKVCNRMSSVTDELLRA
jgi:glycosyltransferase involved in cell wall biosynthesis